MSETLTIPDRLARLDQFIAEGRVIRRRWKGEDADGRELACLLAALSPECSAAEEADACPAELMPGWMAEVTPWIDDAGTAEAWPATMRRYAAAAHRWQALDAAAWERVRSGWLADDVIPEALSHVTEDGWGVREACEWVRGALRGHGDLSAARAAAAALAAALAAEEEAWAAKAGWAAKAALAAAAAAAAAAALAAAAAAEEAWAAKAGWAAKAAWAAWTPEAADRLSAALLGRIEAECDAAEI